ncbi:hypothetical protein ACJJTC_008178 [Scirpophaga incertulas]
MNARPLTYIEDERTFSLEPLTLNCFLHSLPSTFVSDLDQIDRTNFNCRLRDDFKTRFRKEYLTSLIQKNTHKTDEVRGDIVIVQTADKTLNWLLGLIFEIKNGVQKHEVLTLLLLQNSASFVTYEEATKILNEFERRFALDVNEIENILFTFNCTNIQEISSSSSDLFNMEYTAHEDEMLKLISEINLKARAGDSNPFWSSIPEMKYPLIKQIALQITESAFSHVKVKIKISYSSHKITI